MQQDDFEKLVDGLFMEAAFEAGFCLGENDKGENTISVDIHGEIDITEKLYGFASEILAGFMMLRSSDEEIH